MGDDPRLYDLVPWRYAIHRWGELSPEAKHLAKPQQRLYIPARIRAHPERREEFMASVGAYFAPATQRDPDGCPECGARRGDKGFLRFEWPVSHELFGRAICCRRCWAYPFGEAPGIEQGELARALTDGWERKLREMRQRAAENPSKADISQDEADHEHLINPRPDLTEDVDLWARLKWDACGKWGQR